MRQSGLAAKPSDTLRALVGRCEREEPSQELSEAIALATGWRTVFLYSAPWWSPPGSTEWVMGTECYTTSLDAAVTLVPEDCDVDLQRYWMREGERWSANLSWGISGDYVEILDAKTGALALCAAALCARAAVAEASVSPSGKAASVTTPIIKEG